MIDKEGCTAEPKWWQASDDARRMVDEARKNAQAEVDAARGTVLRVEAALEDQAESLSIAEKEVCYKWIRLGV